MFRVRPGLALLLVSASLVACAGDPATFRPAKGAVDRPAVKDSYRLHTVSEDCISLGFINAEGERALADIAETAARHGANNFVIRVDDGDERVTSRKSSSEVVTRTNHRLVAEAYHCGLPDGADR